MSRWDVIVVGAGHNGLTAAALLARGGRKVLLLERRAMVGGLAAAEEFQPGYRSAGVLHDTTAVRRAVVDALELERHGLRLRDAPPAVFALGAERALLVEGPRERVVAALAKHASRDSERYVELRSFLDRIRPVLRQYLDRPPLDLVDVDNNGLGELARRGLGLRRLGRRTMMELLRLPPMCVADWLDEWFASDLLKAGLALPALGSTYMGPRSPGSNFNFLLRDAAADVGVHGGGAALVAAVERAARAAGVEVRTSTTVARIRVERGAVRGVVTDHGEELSADIVAASSDPKQTFLRLLPPGAAGQRLTTRIAALRTRGTLAHVLLAATAPPRFVSCNGETVELARTAADLRQIERAHDAVKYRTIPRTPVLDIHVPTVDSPDLAPPGHAVVSVLVHFVPHDLEPSWTDGERERLGDRVVELLEQHAPGFAATVLGRQVLDPVELESRYGVSGGHLFHGEHALDQLLVRPVPECVRYATPIAGLYLCGSGSHPGGGLTCAPGRLAAETILRS